MQPMQAAPAIDTAKINHLQADDDGIEIGWTDGHRSYFHALWLRDCCSCEICGDTLSSKRFFVPSDVPADLRIERAGIDDAGNLSLHWQPQNHASHYDAGWLRRHCYDDASRAARFQQPILWRSDIANAIPTVDFRAAQDDDVERMALYRKLRDYGMVRITGGPAEAGGVEGVARLIGDLAESAYTPIFDLSPSSKVKTMGNTFREVPPHTDEAFRYAPPGINILGCVQPAESGGETVLVDGFAVAEDLRKNDTAAFDLLCRYGQTFNRVHPGELDQRSRLRMIALDDRDEVVGIRVHTRAAGPLDLPSDKVVPYYRAHQAFCTRMMSPEFQLRFRLEAGDSVMFDNHRALHARAEFSDPRRFLQICNVSRETFHERLRLLAAALGHDDEADQIMTAGMAF